ncbi:MAG: MopE-related protein [Myxococcota bacterium]
MRFAVAAVCLAWVPGCTYITSRELEDKWKSLDEDHDRSTFDEDCDDEDPDRSPAFDEVPYDGIDNDCGENGDAVDLDGDGYPGITAEDYAALEPREDYPPELVGKALDCIDDPARMPAAADIYPGNGSDVPYDGLDSNCDRSNDFDNDGDGYVPALYAAAFDSYVTAWGYEGQLGLWAPSGLAEPLPGDCDDRDPATHPDPGVPDAWYDGVDLDCDGANDFDRDGDGYMPPAVPAGDTEGLYNAFVSKYLTTPPELPPDVTLPDGTVLTAFSDCLDQVNPDIVPAGETDPVDPAQVYPRAGSGADEWYDGVDTNCWADNDFDQDGDAFYPSVVDLGGGELLDGEALYEDYVADWGYTDREQDWAIAAGVFQPGPGDCVDTDPLTYPAALETIGDGVDQDCDGSADAASFSFADWAWTRPSAARIVRLGDTYVWALTAAVAESAGNEVLEVGYAMSVRLEDAATGAVPASAQFKGASPEQPVGDALDLTPFVVQSDVTNDGLDDPSAWVSTTVTVDSNGFTYLRGWRLYEHSGAGTLGITTNVSNYTLTAYDATSIEVAVNNAGEPYLLACTDDLIHAIQGIAQQPSEPELEDPTEDAGGVCMMNTPPYALGADEVVEFTRCNATKCQEFQLVRSAADLVVTPGGLTGESWTRANSHGPLQILQDTDSTVVRDTTLGTETLVFPGEVVVSADAMMRGLELFVVAVIDDPVDGEQVRLRYGVPPTFTDLPLPFAHPTLPDVVPAEVALHVDDDRVLVVVTARDPGGAPGADAVGWMFVGAP